MVGTGYVGLVAGTGLSDFGMNVTCVDIEEDKIAALNRGEVPIYEIGLSDLIKRNVKLERLRFSTDLKSAIDRCLVIFLALGTPERPDGSSDLSAIYKVAEDIGRHMTEYKIVAIKSTVPVGTARRIEEIIRKNQERPIDFDVVSNPEFLRQGAAVDDFLHPNRVILGSDSKRALAIMRDIYRPLYLLDTPIISTSNETAELIKYASNTMLALRISYINEIANICDHTGADVYQVAKALGMDKRIGPFFLHPGPGFGGSCFPKDVKAMVALSDEVGYDFKIGRAIIDVNITQKERVVKKARDMIGELKGKTVTLLGISFKPNTDDLREAPAVHVAKRLLEEGAEVHNYDPIAMEKARKVLPDLKYFNNAYEACRDSDLVIIITEWNEFRDLDFGRIKEVMRNPNIYDTRNIYDGNSITEQGFNYISTGRNFRPCE